MDNRIDLERYIRSIADWPKKGILFRDITPLLAAPQAFAAAIEALCSGFAGKGIDYVAAVEARGFIFGSAVAEKLAAGFVPIRKKGKLPYKTVEYTYEKEYGPDTVIMHIDSIEPGEKVLVVDDLLATGGTALAAAKLVEELKGEVFELAFLIELTGSLHGRKFLEDKGYKVWAHIPIEVEE